MNISVIGYVNGDSSQNGVRIAQAWSLQGHNVQILDFSTPDLLNQISSHSPAFVFVTMGREFNHAPIKKLHDGGIFTVNWIPDEYSPNDFGGEWFEQIIGAYNLLLCETKGIIPFLQDYADEAIWVPMYFDDLYHKSQHSTRFLFDRDLGFLGGANLAQSTVRTEYLRKLKNNGYNIEVGGGALRGLPWLVNGQMADFYMKTKISLNFKNDKLPEYELGVSNRILKVVGSGGFLLTQDFPGIETYLTPDEHCVTYSAMDYADLTSTIDFYLANVALREQIAAAGCAHIRKNFNIEKITKFFLDEIVSRQV